MKPGGKTPRPGVEKPVTDTENKNRKEKNQLRELSFQARAKKFSQQRFSHEASGRILGLEYAL